VAADDRGDRALHAREQLHEPGGAAGHLVHGDDRDPRLLHGAARRREPRVRLEEQLAQPRARADGGPHHGAIVTAPALLAVPEADPDRLHHPSSRYQVPIGFARMIVSLD
jgi:hypothetical protein